MITNNIVTKKTDSLGKYSRAEVKPGPAVYEPRFDSIKKSSRTGGLFCKFDRFPDYQTKIQNNMPNKIIGPGEYNFSPTIGSQNSTTYTNNQNTKSTVLNNLINVNSSCIISKNKDSSEDQNTTRS